MNNILTGYVYLSDAVLELEGQVLHKSDIIQQLQTVIEQNRRDTVDFIRNFGIKIKKATESKIQLELERRLHKELLKRSIEMDLMLKVTVTKLNEEHELQVKSLQRQNNIAWTCASVLGIFGVFTHFRT